MTHPEPVLLFAAAAPAAHGLVALAAARQPGARPLLVLRLADAAGAVGVVSALVVAAAAAAGGPVAGPLPLAGSLGLALRVDSLSAAMLALVAFLGAVVLRYSRAYLAGDPRHGAFVGRLAATIAAAMALVLSGDLVQLTLAWIATSLALQRLLLFYRDRPRAVVAARKKFVVARLGDAALAAAAVLLWRAFGTTDIGLLLERASAASGGSVPLAVHAAAGLVVATAALKSAQFPTHGWLADVMDTPTPVSALLHAGLLNGGTFLLVRLAPVLLLSPPALHAMVVIGAVTAVFASTVMITQPTVKGALAYSSAAHMGFMMLVCGLGVYTLAVLHLIAHSCYKAHAFLSSGSAVEVARAAHVPGGDARPGPATLLAPVLAVATVAGVGTLAGVSLGERPVDLALAAMLAVGLTHLLAHATAGRASVRVVARTVAAAAGTALSFFALEIAGARMLGDVVPVVSLTDPVTLALAAVVTLTFALVSVGQVLLPAFASSPRWATAYVWVRNGFYANAVFDRVVGALRAPAARPSRGETI